MKNPFLRHRSDTFLIILILAMVLFGVVMIYSASVILAHNSYGDDTLFVRKQAIWALLGFVGMLILSGIDYKVWKKWAGWMLAISLLLLISVFFLSKGEINGAHRWITVAGQTFQPSELAKLSLIIYFSGWLSTREKDMRSIGKTFIPLVVVLSTISYLMLKEPDFGTLMVMLAAAIAIYFVAGISWQQVVLGGVLFICLVGGLAMSSSYRRERIMTFFKPNANTDSTALTTAYHVNNIGIAVGSGGLWGLGFGESRQKRGFLPEPQTDSIFAVTTEELGAVRSALIILAFALLAFRGLRIALLAPDRFAALLAVGITAWFIFQAFINLGAMLQLVPLVGIPLPFISYGGSNLVISMLAVGILLNISKYTLKPTVTMSRRRS